MERCLMTKKGSRRRTCALSAHARRQGIEIVPATGRTMRGLPDELRNLPGVHYAILTNGAQVVDLAKNEIIDSCRIRWLWQKRS